MEEVTATLKKFGAPTKTKTCKVVNLLINHLNAKCAEKEKKAGKKTGDQTQVGESSTSHKSAPQAERLSVSLNPA